MIFNNTILFQVKQYSEKKNKDESSREVYLEKINNMKNKVQHIAISFLGVGISAANSEYRTIIFSALDHLFLIK